MYVFIFLRFFSISRYLETRASDVKELCFVVLLESFFKNIYNFSFQLALAAGISLDALAAMMKASDIAAQRRDAALALLTSHLELVPRAAGDPWPPPTSAVTRAPLTRAVFARCVRCASIIEDINDVFHGSWLQCCPLCFGRWVRATK